MVAAPHTSNWDFVLAMGSALALRIDLRWLGKAEIFRGPAAPVMRALGGIPVDRRNPAGLVEAVVAEAQHRAGFVLAVAPEGTRQATPRWRSGFHRIALGAGLPIVPVSVDWRTRTMTFLPPFQPTSDFEADVQALGRHFVPEMARHPRQYMPPEPAC